MNIERATGVITSIHPPSEAVEAFAKVSGLDGLIVIGDLKTPRDWACDGVDYWDMDRQLDVYGKLAETLPVNHYARKNLGYLVAAQDSTGIYDTDDDNLPRPNWRLPYGEGQARTVTPDQGFVNVYQHFTEKLIWPRGHPIDQLDKKIELAAAGSDVPEVRVWQGLADMDPDVDAVFRMVIGDAEISFADTAPLVLTPGSYAPINSQNTLFLHDAFPLLYLPVTVTMRYTDILRGYVALAVLQSQGQQVGYTSPLVYQERNLHDPMQDFTDEVPMYLTCKAVMAALVEECTAHAGASVPDRIRACYMRLEKMEVVQPSELALLDLWLAQMEAACAMSQQAAASDVARAAVGL